MKIWCVEDDASIRDIEIYTLNSTGFEARGFENGEDFFAALAQETPDLVILDVMLPGMSGTEIVHQMRGQQVSTPVLMLTARASLADKVEGLDAGADDYMTKPFEAEELLARLRALTRRRGDVLLDEVSFADVSLDLSTHDLSCGERKVHLSGKEFEVMSILMSSSARVVSKQDLLTRVWGADAEASENSVEAYVSFLRKKLQNVGSMVQITTLRMLGYRLEVFGN